jgi:hypothetical protein
MSRRLRAIAWAGVISKGLASTSLAVEYVPAGVPVDKDMTAMIALQGLPCGKVVRAVAQGNDDYLATCENGVRYHVFIDADGGVVVEKRD